MKTNEFLEKNSIKETDIVEAETKKGTFNGTIMKSAESEENILRLKLKSGYNVGIEVSEIKNIKKIKREEKKVKTKTEIKQNLKLPKISILHTGGTIASRIDYRTGAVFSSFEPEDLLKMFPELLEKGKFSSKLISNMWSDDLRFTHITKMAEAIEKEINEGTEGIILGMGTDNMAVASAALSFTLEKCPIPIIIVGAQRSSDRGSSDAAINLLCATEFITKTDFAGIAICMHYSSSDDKCAILPACKTKKLHSSRRDAFKAVNTTPIALIDYKNSKIEFLKKNYVKKGKGVIVKKKFEEKVGILKVQMNMFAEQIDFFRREKFKGLVIEGTGLGHTPGHNPDGQAKENEKIFPAIKKLVESGCVVVMTTNTVFGRVHMHVYDKGTDLADLGVISGEDMLTETAFVKLAWLLANEPKKVKRLIGKSLRGEITEATKYNEELI